MDSLEGYTSDDDLAVAPLRSLGWETETVSWCARRSDWVDFDAVIIRTTWDYQQRPKEFIAVLEGIERQTTLLNPLSIVRWNLSKTYLRDMSDAGCPIVPTIWGPNYSPVKFENWQRHFGTRELIVKPAVSATAENTFRLMNYDATLEDIFAERAFMVQPFVPAITDEGEYSLFYFNGEYSHAILKSPRPADFRVQEEHGGIITAIEPDADLLDAGDNAIDALKYAFRQKGDVPDCWSIDEELLYARVDLVRFGRGFALMELELIEPALYLRMDPGAPLRFARAIESMLSPGSARIRS